MDFRETLDSDIEKLTAKAIKTIEDTRLFFGDKAPGYSHTDSIELYLTDRRENGVGELDLTLREYLLRATYVGRKKPAAIFSDVKRMIGESITVPAQ